MVRARRTRVGLGLLLSSLLGAVLATSSVSPTVAGAAISDTDINGVRRSGANLVDYDGEPIQLRGVNRAASEFACIGGWGFFHEDDNGDPTDGDVHTPNAQTLVAMESWGINTVRVPLNSDCWLGDAVKPGTETPNDNFDTTGAAYRAAMREWVDQIVARGMVAILDLHWSAPLGVRADSQQPAPDADTSPMFWTQVATEFGDEKNVVFELYNEPYQNREADGGVVGDDIDNADEAWGCWAEGCKIHRYQGPTQALVDPPAYYQATGMKQLLAAVRATGADNVVLLGGLNYAQDFSQFVAHLPVVAPNDTQIGAAFHAYPGNTCGLDDNPCWSGTIAPLAAQLPVVATEYGQSNCTGNGIEGFLDRADAVGMHYVAWTWQRSGSADADGCGDDPYDVIKHYDTGDPTNVGAPIKTHYLERAVQPPPPTNPVLGLAVTAAPTEVTAPGGPVTFTVRATLTGNGGAATITSVTDSILGSLAQPQANLPGVTANTCDDGFVNAQLTAPAERTCQFTVAVQGGAGQTITRTLTVTARVDAVAIAAVGDPLSATQQVQVRVVAPGGGTTGGTTGGGATGGGTGGGPTGGTTGGGTTTTTTRPAATTTTTRPSTSTSTTAAGVGGAGGATTTSVAHRTIPVTGANTDQLLLAALALVGLGMVVTGRSEVRVAAVGRRRR